MRIKRFMLGPILANGYVISKDDGRSCYIIDPGYEPERYTKYIKESGLEPAGIILTHHHYDHSDYADELSEIYGIPVYMHEADIRRYKGHVDRPLIDGDVIDMDGEKLKIISTPGHTKGSICILSEASGVCFTGDTLFDTDLGRTDLADGDEDEMRRSVCEILDRFPDSLQIWPGHEGNCDMRFVRKHNAEFKALRDGLDR